MKHITIILFILFFSETCFSQNFNEYYFKFKVKDKSEINELTKIISIDNVKNDTVYAYATDRNFNNFKKLKYKYTLLNNSSKTTKADMATTVAEMNNWDKYPTYDVYIEMMNNYASLYPDICKIINIGKSVNNRDLLVLKISDNINTEEEEPEFFYSSTMHGDETTGMILMLRLIDSLLSNYNSEPEIKNIIDSIELYINPNANPDGTYAGGDDIIGNLSTRSNANGIDINRNFPDPVGGEHPDGESWQPETEAMINFAHKHNFVMSANFHGGVELANYPWDHTSRRHADDEWFIDVARNYATSCQDNSPSGYFTDQNNGITNGADWYVVYGGRQDYFTYFHHCREITFEISDTKIIPAANLPDYWNYNKQALIDYMKECLYGIRGTIKDIYGNPVNAMISIVNHDTIIDSSMVFTDINLGDYYRPIEPGNYTVIAHAKGFYNDTAYNIVVNENQITHLNFVLFDSVYSVIRPEAINDTLEQGDSSQYCITIKNEGLANIEYSIYQNTAKQWMSIEKETGIIYPDQTDSINININSTGLNPGDYSAKLVISENEEKTVYIPVNLNVNNVQAIPNTFDSFKYVNIYPNPFCNLLTLEYYLNKKGILQITIYNATGQKVFYQQKNSFSNWNRTTVNGIGNLPNGIYYIQLKTDQHKISKSIIKQ